MIQNNITTLPRLFKRDTKGRVRFWEIEFDGPVFRTREGLQGGKVSVSAPTQCETMNAGRANERDPEAQAEFEARAKWTKKKDTGYAETVEASGAAYVEPMLAHPHIELDTKGGIKKDRLKDVVWPCMAQPKLDGIRCLIYLKGGKPYAQTRKGQPIKAVPHILAACAPVLQKHPNLIMDGELYTHSLREDFNKISSLVRKQTPTVIECMECEKVMEYHVYDTVLPGAEFLARYYALVSILHNCKPCIKLVPTVSLTEVEEMDAYEEKCVSEGYEGIMLRAQKSMYQGKRTVDLLKVKRFQDAEFPIVRIEEGRGNRAGLASRVWVRLKDGQECAAGVMGTNAVVAELFKNRARYAGKPATIKFLNYTPGGMLRAAKMKGIRRD